MKKILISLIVVLSLILTTKAQHFIPVDLVANAKNINVALYGGFSIDGGNGADFIQALSNTAQSGFIVNALYRTKQANNGTTETFQQFLIDVNPIIINWDPFTWNKLVKQPVDSFSAYKMPFQEDALLHIGWHKTSLSKFFLGSGKNQLQLFQMFGELYWRPYNIYKTESIEHNYRFQVFNINTGIQFGYLKKEVPVLGNFLIATSLQFNYMMTNEADNYLGSLEHLMSGKGKNFIGPGLKISVQTNFLNIYIEGRQYYAIDPGFSGVKFTQEPIILVGAFGNINWTKKKNQNSNNNNNNDNIIH